MTTADRIAVLERDLRITIAEGGDCTELHTELDALHAARRPVVAYRVHAGVAHAGCALPDGPVVEYGEPLHDLPAGHCVLCHKPMRSAA